MVGGLWGLGHVRGNRSTASRIVGDHPNSPRPSYRPLPLFDAAIRIRFDPAGGEQDVLPDRPLRRAVRAACNRCNGCNGRNDRLDIQFRHRRVTLTKTLVRIPRDVKGDLPRGVSVSGHPIVCGSYYAHDIIRR